MSMERRVVTPKFKVEAIRLVTEKGMKFRETAEQLGIQETVLRAWKKMWDRKGADAFPGNGKLSGRDTEMARLLEENTVHTDNHGVIQIA